VPGRGYRASDPGDQAVGAGLRGGADRHPDSVSVLGDLQEIAVSGEGGAKSHGPFGRNHGRTTTDGLRGRYEHFISFARQLRDTTAAGQVPPMDALIARTRVMDEWRAFPILDPDLPAELLPAAWTRAQARELFIGCYDLLGPLAARRVRQIITRYSPELAGRAAYHSSELKLSAAVLAASLSSSGPPRIAELSSVIRESSSGGCGQGFLPTPPKTSISAGMPSGEGSGRQRGQETTPRPGHPL